MRLSFGGDGMRQSITAMAYSAGWNATDQIPQRAVATGLVGRFGAIDPSDGGQTERFSLSYRLESATRNGTFKLDAYAIRSRLDLWSDFTFFLDHPSDLGPAANPSGIAGDQFEQAERRRVFGLTTSRAWNTSLFGRDTVNTVGLQLRHDRLDPVALYSTEGRRRAGTVQESRVRETSIGLYAENTLQWTKWLRSIAGMRAERFDFDVNSSIAGNSGKAQATLASPKLSLIFGPWRRPNTSSISAAAFTATTPEARPKR